MNFLDTAIKHIFFSVCLFFLFTNTSRNKAIIVEFKTLFVLNGTFITFPGGSNHYACRALLQCLTNSHKS